MGPLLKNGLLTPVLGVLAAAAAALGCGPSGVEMQALPPEIAALNGAYDAPTGTVPASAMQQILGLQQTLDAIAQSHLVDVVSAALVSLRARVSEGGLATDPVATPKRDWPLVNGSVTVTQICRGWDPASTTPNPNDGSIQVMAQYQGSVLQRTILGSASSCHARIDVHNGSSLNVFLDGQLGLFLDGPLPADESQATFLMTWNGALGTASSQVQASFDFRIVPPALEVRVPAVGGDVIGTVGGGQVSLRGANGTFGCSFETFACGVTALPSSPAM